MKLSILGTRGIPARHGGFETFCERLAVYLATQGWTVSVYCQEKGSGPLYESHWRNVRLIHIPIRNEKALGTILFDFKSVLHALRERPLSLTLGYNTAVFTVLFRLGRVVNVINMDGIEWKRKKWGPISRVWLRVNEAAGALLANHMVADNPEIKKHLTRYVRSTKISTIAYGSDLVSGAEHGHLTRFDLKENGYAIVIARPEPENSILEIVRAFASRPRDVKLVVVGAYEDSRVPYHRRVYDAANEDVLFVGPIYEHDVLSALRYFSLLYIHGHQVGGSNPSLIEALGVGNPVLAHDNRFNRWVAGRAGCYFADELECAQELDRLLAHPQLLRDMGAAARARHQEAFAWEKILRAYESMLASAAGH